MRMQYTLLSNRVQTAIFISLKTEILLTASDSKSLILKSVVQTMTILEFIKKSYKAYLFIKLFNLKTKKQTHLIKSNECI